MNRLLLKHLSVYLVAAVKFLGGIILGTVEKLNFLEIALFSFLGSMTTIVVISYLGNKYRHTLSTFFRNIKLSYYKIKLLLLINLKLTNKSKIHLLEEVISYGMKPKKFTKTTRLVFTTWKKFGVLGISILTPLLLSPIGGALLCVSFRVKTSKIISYMVIVHAISALLFAYVFVEFKEYLQLWFGLRLEKGH